MDSVSLMSSARRVLGLDRPLPFFDFVAEHAPEIDSKSVVTRGASQRQWWQLSLTLKWSLSELVIVASHIDQNNRKVDGAMIKRFWESLRIGLWEHCCPPIDIEHHCIR